MSKVIAVTGKSGSGKSTFAVNLASGLAEKNYVVILISANLNHAGVQVFFNEIITEEQGIFAALNDTSEQPQNKLTPCKKQENIFLLGVPNNRAEIFNESLEQKTVENLLRRLGVCADYIIVDCTSDLYNPMTLMGLHLADKIYCTYTASIESCLWHRTMHGFFQQFNAVDLITPVIAQFNIGCSIQELEKMDGFIGHFVLPQVESAVILQNSGRPIYFERTKDCKLYQQEIGRIIDALQEELANGR